jgi:hypothetical protein
LTRVVQITEKESVCYWLLIQELDFMTIGSHGCKMRHVKSV